MKFVRTELDGRWDRFVEASPQGSIFSTSAFLKSFNADAYYVKKGNQVIGGFVGVEQDGNIIQAPHLIHSGILFASHHQDKNTAQRHATEFDITVFIITEITRIYKDIEFTLSPEFKDMRPFQWYNYQNEGRKFDINIRYTSYLSPDYNQSSNSRKQILRNITDEPKVIEDPLNIHSLAMDYFVLYGNHPIGIMKSLLENKMLVVLCCEGDRLAIGVYKDMGYMLWQIGKEHATRLLWTAMRNLNCSVFDLEGINSPKRGAFKLSFGGSITPYYRVKLTPQ